MRRLARIFALVIVAVSVAVATGCGGDEEGKGIPSASADQLFAQLDDVQKRIDQGSAGACRDIIEAPDERGADKKQVQEVIDSLPDDVDSDVKSALQDSFDHLWDLVEQECEDRESKQDTNTTPTETHEETTPTETQEETTPTQPEETTPTETTPPAEEELPGGEGNGNGGGAVPGAGNGGGAGPGAQKLEKKAEKK
ncbi:MAG TPA: hypothetical protein VJT68_01750 [Thermoleophilaceae bacterium]|nr:hypothetical protein [Thermoleophilaceae bacterium]